jgi:hypothetical protein
LRYVAHRAAQVFGLERVKNRGLHKRIAPRGTALFNELKVILHRLIQPHNFRWGLNLRVKPETVLVDFTKIVWIVAVVLPR